MTKKILEILKQLAGAALPDATLTIGPGSRISRIRIRKRPADRILIGAESLVEASLIFDRSPAIIEIGDRTFIGRSTVIAAERVTIGSDVLISWHVTIVDHDSHSLDFALRSRDVVEWGQGRKDWSNISIAPVRICDKVWVGFGASILKGTTIGEGAVVAAQSVVTRDVPPWTLVAGNPARPIRQLEPRP